MMMGLVCCVQCLTVFLRKLNGEQTAGRVLSKNEIAGLLIKNGKPQKIRFGKSS